MKQNCLNSIFIGKLIETIFHTYIVSYACIVYTPTKMTLLNILSCTFIMFFPALSSTSLIINAFCRPDIHFLAFFETGILISMVIASSIIQFCRSKIIMNENDVKKIYKLFSYSETETEERIFAPIMIIISQVLIVILCLYKKIYSSEPNKFRIIEKNKFTPPKISKYSNTECNDESVEQNEGMSKESEICKKKLKENILIQQENTEENLYLPDENSNEFRDIHISNENYHEDRKIEKNLEIVSSNERRKIKPPPCLYLVPCNKELDSSFSEIHSHDDTCLSVLDTEDDISLSTVKIDNSVSNRSVFSLTDCRQFANELDVGSSSSPRCKNEENATVRVGENLDLSVQFPMDLTPVKSKMLTIIDVSSGNIISNIDIESSDVQHRFPPPAKYSENLESQIPITIKKNDENRFKKILREFKLSGDTEIENKFINAVKSFEAVEDCDFLEWTYTKTKSTQNVSKFLKYVEGKSNKEKIEKILQEQMTKVIPCKEAEITFDPQRMSNKEIKLTFLKNDHTFKKLLKDCEKVINSIEDFNVPNKFDMEKLEFNASLAKLNDNFAMMLAENEKRSMNELHYIRLVTQRNNIFETKIKLATISNESELNRNEDVGTVSSEKEPNLDKLPKDKIPILGKNINTPNKLDPNETLFTEKYHILDEDTKEILIPTEENENADSSVQERKKNYLNTSSNSNLEDSFENKYQEQEKNINKNKEFVLDSKEYVERIEDSKFIPSNPISIKIKNSDSEEEIDDFINAFEKIEKSINENESFSPKSFKIYEKLYYDNESFLRAILCIKSKHEKNKKRRKEQEEKISDAINLIYIKLNNLGMKKA